LLCFFFFQAEDGIRDRTVTGVQTCALPIYDRAVLVDPHAVGDVDDAEQLVDDVGLVEERGVVGVGPVDELLGGVEEHRVNRSLRSEERRVGKEWRSRGSWDDEKEEARG